jgi:hypothetical protein
LEGTFWGKFSEGFLKFMLSYTDDRRKVETELSLHGGEMLERNCCGARVGVQERAIGWQWTGATAATAHTETERQYKWEGASRAAIGG